MEFCILSMGINMVSLEDSLGLFVRHLGPHLVGLLHLQIRVIPIDKSGIVRLPNSSLKYYEIYAVHSTFEHDRSRCGAQRRPEASNMTLSCSSEANGAKLG